MRFPLPTALFILSLLLCAGAFGQADASVRELHLVNITTDDGLPQGMVEDILQDRYGFLWSTTKDGLARSDGYGFTIFKHDAEDSTSIAGNHSNLLYEDSHGSIWIAVSGQGLDRYDPRTGDFAHVAIAADVPKQTFNEITAMVEAPDGAIWCLSSYRQLSVVKSDPATGRMSLKPVEKVLPLARLPVRPSGIAFDGSGMLWILNDSVLVVGEVGSAGAFVPAQRWSLPAPTRTVEGEVAPHLLMYWEQAQEMVLCLPGSFLRISTRDRAVVDTIAVGPTARILEAQLIDEQDRLWYRCDDRQIRRLQLHTGELEHLELFVGEKNVYDRMETAFFSCQDERGNFWAGTKGYGILKLSRNANHFSARPGEPIIGYHVNEYTIHGHKQFAMTRHRIGQEPAMAPEGLDRYGFGTKAWGKNWEGAATDAQGRTWGVLADGDRSPPLLCHVDEQGRFEHSDLLRPGEMPNRVFHGAGADIWVTTAPAAGSWNIRHGLARIDTRNLSVTARYEFPIPFLLTKYWPISQWSVAPDGVIWMATIEGLLSLDPDANTWHVFKHDPKDPTSLPHDLLFSMCPDPNEPEHFLWVGTEGGGMAKLDKRSGKCVRYSTRNGLPNDVVYSILSDPSGRLWVGTNTGLCRFDPEGNTARTYTNADGIAGNEFNRYGSLVLPDGAFFFDGMDGGTLFHPEDLLPDTTASHTLLTGVRLSTHALAMHQLTDAAGAPATITMPHDEPLVTFRFAVMDHTDPGQNTFRYRMDGYTDGWIDGGTRNEATFTNLDPGTYTFTVQGTNNAGVQDPVGATLLLTITPPWWGTWWFRTLLALFCLGIVLAIFRIRLAQKLRVLHLREKIARDLHDEIGSTLSSISMYGAVAQKRLNGIPATEKQLLEKITDGTTHAMEVMNDIVWAVNSENDDLEHLVQRMNAYAANLAQIKGFKIDLETDAGLKKIPLDMGQRKDLYLLFKEAVNNAAKYSQCQRLTVTIHKRKGGFVLRIMDDGVGFDPSTVGSVNPLGGNGLSNMTKRAADMGAVLEITSATNAGTCLEIRFGADPISLEPMRDGASGHQ